MLLKKDEVDPFVLIFEDRRHLSKKQFTQWLICFKAVLKLICINSPFMLKLCVCVYALKFWKDIATVV